MFTHRINEDNPLLPEVYKQILPTPVGCSSFCPGRSQSWPPAAPCHGVTHFHPQAGSGLPLLSQPAHHLSPSSAIPGHGLFWTGLHIMKSSRAHLGMQGNFIKKLIFQEVCKPWNSSFSRCLPSYFLTHINTTSSASPCPPALFKINCGQLQHAAVLWLQKRPQSSSVASSCCIFCTTKKKGLEEKNMSEH